jgi:hypothetical protein
MSVWRFARNEKFFFRCKGSWRQIRVSYRTITRAKNKILCARESLMSSIEWYTQISEQDKKQLSINETLNFYHRENFFKKYSLKIFDLLAVPPSKITSFDAARRALSNDISQIRTTKTNINIRIRKPVKQVSKGMFHLPIRFRTCTTCETYSIRLTLKRSIDWYIFHHY